MVLGVLGPGSTAFPSLIITFAAAKIVEPTVRAGDLMHRLLVSVD